ncbi:MAG: 16S rRNA (cytidine(1402)-2'-O)-methyltransferase [Patescibacteria group bacterium]
MKGKLYVVATPIGNMKDITQRAVDVLREVDIVICEDTRVTGKLLSTLGIKKPLKSLHEHTELEKLNRLVEELSDGISAAYTSDAGTPGLSDPGGKLVAVAAEKDIVTIPIPGPSALAAAVSVCGFPMSQFSFLGFPPTKKHRSFFFDKISGDQSPCVFYESTHRILKTLEELRKRLSANRKIFIGRELTKMHEQIYRGMISEVIDQLTKSSQKGEFVIVVGPENH